MRLALLLVAVRGAAGEWGKSINTVYDCQYDLTKEQCHPCPPWDEVYAFHEWPNVDDDDQVNDKWLPRTRTCIGSEEGCCKVTKTEVQYFSKSIYEPLTQPDMTDLETEYEYFKKSSLANYFPGREVEFYYPGVGYEFTNDFLTGLDRIIWLEEYVEDDPLWNTEFAKPPKGRCVWTGDYTIEVARCKAMPAPPPFPPSPPSTPPPTNPDPYAPPSPPPPGQPPSPPPPSAPPLKPPACDSRVWRGWAYIDHWRPVDDIGTLNWTHFQTHIYFKDCCAIPEMTYADGGVIQALGDLWCNTYMAQDENGNRASDYCPIACRYFNANTTIRYRDEVGLRGQGSLCEETLCEEGAEYPIGTDEGRHATKYFGDAATTGYVPSTDPLSTEYDPNPYASLSPQLPPQPSTPSPPSEPSLLKSPVPPDPPLPPPAYPPGMVPSPFPPGAAISPPPARSPSPPPPPNPPPPSPPPPSPPPSPPPPSPPPPQVIPYSPPPPPDPPAAIPPPPSPSPPPPPFPPPSPPPSPPPPSPPPPSPFGPPIVVPFSPPPPPGEAKPSPPPSPSPPPPPNPPPPSTPPPGPPPSPPPPSPPPPIIIPFSPPPPPARRRLVDEEDAGAPPPPPGRQLDGDEQAVGDDLAREKIADARTVLGDDVADDEMEIADEETEAVPGASA